MICSFPEYHGVPVALCYRLLTNTSCVCISPFFGSVLHHPPAASQNHLPVPLTIQEPASGYLVQGNPHVLFIIVLNPPPHLRLRVACPILSLALCVPILTLNLYGLLSCILVLCYCVFVVFFLLTRQKLESFEERECQLRKPSYQIGL